MMKRSFRDAWTAMLRSGEYTQEQCVLFMPTDKKCRCCLGVAYDVYNTPLPPFEKTMPLQDDLDAWGLHNDEAEKLASMNDNYGCSFAIIADYIDTLPVEEDA